MNRICKICKSYFLETLKIIDKFGKIQMVNLSKFIHSKEHKCPKRSINDFITSKCHPDFENIIHCHNKYNNKCIPFIENCETHYHRCSWECHEECKCQKT